MRRILQVVAALGLAAILQAAEKPAKRPQKEAAGQHIQQPQVAKPRKAITVSVKPFTKSAEPLPQFAKRRRAAKGKGVR